MKISQLLDILGAKQEIVKNDDQLQKQSAEEGAPVPEQGAPTPEEIMARAAEARRRYELLMRAQSQREAYEEVQRNQQETPAIRRYREELEDIKDRVQRIPDPTTQELNRDQRNRAAEKCVDALQKLKRLIAGLEEVQENVIAQGLLTDARGMQADLQHRLIVLLKKELETVNSRSALRRARPVIEQLPLTESQTDYLLAYVDERIDQLEDNGSSGDESIMDLNLVEQAEQSIEASQQMRQDALQMEDMWAELATYQIWIMLAENQIRNVQSREDIDEEARRCAMEDAQSVITEARIRSRTLLEKIRNIFQLFMGSFSE